MGELWGRDVLLGGVNTSCGVESQGEVEEVMLYNSLDVVVEEVIPLLWF